MRAAIDGVVLAHEGVAIVVVVVDKLSGIRIIAAEVWVFRPWVSGRLGGRSHDGSWQGPMRVYGGQWLAICTVPIRRVVAGWR